MPYTCPVCGFADLAEVPRTEERGGSFEICPSCGFQFGVSDDDEGITFEQWRQLWIMHGYPWSSVGIEKPQNWDPHGQLRNIGYS